MSAARHAAPGRRWSPTAYLPGKHRYAGSVRERGDQHVAAVLAVADLPTVPIELPADWSTATVELPRIVATAAARLAAQAPAERFDFRAPVAVAGSR